MGTSELHCTGFSSGTVLLPAGSMGSPCTTYSPAPLPGLRHLRTLASTPRQVSSFSFAGGWRGERSHEDPLLCIPLCRRRQVDVHHRLDSTGCHLMDASVAAGEPRSAMCMASDWARFFAVSHYKTLKVVPPHSMVLSGPLAGPWGGRWHPDARCRH